MEVGKFLSALISLWRRLVILHRGHMVSFKKDVQRNAEAIHQRCTKKGAFDFVCALDELIDEKYTSQWAECKETALELVEATRNYQRLAHSYGKAEATAESFEKFGGERAWIDLESIEQAALRGIAETVARATGEKLEANAEPDTAETTLETLHELAWDEHWSGKEVDQLMYKRYKHMYNAASLSTNLQYDRLLWQWDVERRKEEWWRRVE